MVTWGQEEKAVTCCHMPPPPCLSPEAEFHWQDVTSQISEVSLFRGEDNAGDQDKSSDQQKGEKIEQHQESQQHKEGLDPTAKVSCGGKVLLKRLK